MAIEIPNAGSRGTKAPPSGPIASAMMAVVRRIHKLTGNKMSGQPLLYLHTVGAKSGRHRTAAVMAFAEGDDTWLVVASRGGTAGHPSWLYNIAAHPDRIEVEIDGRKIAVTASTLSGEERTGAWRRITTSQPRFSGYEAKTDREIPVVRLAAR
jgi:deazaflavin-dependent oxidoreductase (nitroreductase family)